MKRYSITSTAFEGPVLLGYNDHDYLAFYDNQSDMKPAQLERFLNTYPLHVGQIESFISSTQTLKITPLRTDLNFAAFWAAYDYKRGNKTRAEKLWNKLSDADKNKVFDALPKYDYWLLTHPRQDKAYPETYLAQRRFDEDFEVKKPNPTR